MARADSVGLFWERLNLEKQPSSTVVRPLPAIPETGWTPPEAFPNLAGASRIGLDIETQDERLDELGPGVRRGGKIVGIAVAVDDGAQSWYFPMRHTVQSEMNLDPAAVIAWAKDQLTTSIPKVGANLLYDCDFLAEEGVVVGGQLLDVQIAEPLLDENRYSYKLEVLGKHHLGEGKVRSDLEEWSERAYGRGKMGNNIYRSPPCLVGPYAEGDASLPLRILDCQLPAISSQGLDHLWQIETDLLPMILAMRRHGVRVDLERAQLIDDDLTRKAGEIDAQLRALCGFEVNINASAHLVRAFDKLGVAYPKTEKGNPSFTKDWMEHHPAPICQMIMEQRRLLKYRDTFIRGYIFGTQINGRIHCLFHSMRGDENGTVSGRFSSSLPNLQNIPIRDEYWGPLIRSIFIPDEGCEWVRDDWSQIEYRFLAHFGRGDNGEQVRTLYREDPDTDFHVMVSELTGLGRKAAKNVNFGLVYGMGVPLLASTLDMTVEQAEKEVFSAYHSRVPFVKETYDYASRSAKRHGYVTTILGRRARFGETKTETGALVRQFTHKALNRKLQGSAADLMKKAMVDIWQAGVYDYVPPPHLTVHDELDHSRPRTKAAFTALEEAKHIMETALVLKVPIRADREVGPSWGECK